MRALLILSLAFLVSAGLMTTSIDRCTDECGTEVGLPDSCDDDHVGESDTDRDGQHDGDAPCSSQCPNCARPALVDLPTLAMLATFTKVAFVDVGASITIPGSPSLRSLFRPPRAISRSQSSV